MFASRVPPLVCLVATCLVAGAAAQSCGDACYGRYAPAFCPGGRSITGCCYRHCRVDHISTYRPSGHRRQQEASGNASNYTITTVNNTAVFHHIDQDPYAEYARRRLQSSEDFVCTFMTDYCDFSDIAVRPYAPVAVALTVQLS